MPKEVNVYDISGKVKGKVTLPEVFDTPYRPDIIRKVVKTFIANRRQPYGPNKMAGMQVAVSTWGKGRGVARVQRITNGRRAAESPNNVTGRRAHPPKPEKDWSMKINKKEKRLSKLSALAATADAEKVKARGHKFNEKLTLPVVVEDKFQQLNRIKDVTDALVALGVYDDIERAVNGRKIRAGRGKMRGRRYKTPKSILIVVSDKTEIMKGARNLPGVNIVTPKEINTEYLAPGGDAGRLMIITKSALKEIGGW